MRFSYFAFNSPVARGIFPLIINSTDNFARKWSENARYCP
jgi:hypothetical protein